MTLNSSSAKELKRIMDVEQRSLVNFGILAGQVQLYDRFYQIFALKSLLSFSRRVKLKAAN